MNGAMNSEIPAKPGTLRDLIFRGQDIYAGVAANPSKVDMQGWGSDHGIFAYCIERLQSKLIIEVGPWKGARQSTWPVRCRTSACMAKSSA